MAAIMLSQINRYNQAGGNFYGFRVTETFVEQQFGISIPDEQQTTLGYSEYVSRCRSNPQGFPVPNFAGYETALQMARAMSCASNPLGSFNSNAFGIANTAALQMVAGSPNLTQENSFCSSVIGKVPEWQARAAERGRPSAFVPDWYPGDADHAIFQGSPRSVVVYNSPGSPIHVNWQCPQFVGEPTVYFRPSDGVCVQCSGEVVLDSDGRFYQSCNNGTEALLGIPVVACR